MKLSNGVFSKELHMKAKLEDLDAILQVTALDGSLVFAKVNYNLRSVQFEYLEEESL